MTKLIEMVGFRVGSLTVTGRGPSRKGKTPSSAIARWTCICDCGKTTVVDGRHLRKGTTLSCGCRTGQDPPNVTHGKSKSPEYRVWGHMIGRCTNPNDNGYRLYGGRGIKVHPDFLDFEKFLAHVGERPSPAHTLDRIDVNGDYEPGNLRWADWTQQCNNRRTNRLITHDGETFTLSEWAKKAGISPKAMAARVLVMGWPMERALTEPLHYRGQRRRLALG